jgi:hypothetical protein
MKYTALLLGMMMLLVAAFAMQLPAGGTKQTRNEQKSRNPRDTSDIC